MQAKAPDLTDRDKVGTHVVTTLQNNDNIQKLQLEDISLVDATREIAASFLGKTIFEFGAIIDKWDLDLFAFKCEALKAISRKVARFRLSFSTGSAVEGNDRKSILDRDDDSFSGRN